MLIRMSFPEQVVGWIMVCITTFQFSINVSGELAGYFQGGRGLRQGWVQVLLEVPKEQDFPPCFADDLLIFSKEEVNSVCVIHNVLMEFQSLSGLSPNPDKSDNHLSGIPDGIREQIVQIRRSLLSPQDSRLFIVKPLLIKSLLEFSTRHIDRFHMLDECNW